MSQHILAGEPVPAFIKRGPGATGAWVCRDYRSALKLQRHIGSSAARAKVPGLRVRYKSMASIDDNDPNTAASVKYTVVCMLHTEESRP